MSSEKSKPLGFSEFPQIPRSGSASSLTLNRSSSPSLIYYYYNMSNLSREDPVPRQISTEEEEIEAAMLQPSERERCALIFALVYLSQQ